MTPDVQSPSPPAATLQVRTGLRVLQVIDADPLAYPPTINAARVLAQAGAQVVCLGGMRIARPTLAMPPGVELKYAVYGSWEKGLGKLKWGAGRLAFRAAVAHAARQHNAELIIAYDSGAGWAVLPLLGQPQCKIVLHIHDNENVDAQSWRSLRTYQWTQVRRSAAVFDRLVVPELERGHDLRSSWGINVDFEVVANAPPRSAPERNDTLRKRLGLTDSSGPLAVVVGNIGMLASTVDAIADARARWHLAVIGAQDTKAVQQMLNQAHRRGVENRVHVLPWTSYDSMREWLSSCDVGLGLYPSDAPTINWRLMGSASVKVMEYMAASIPAIVCSRDAFASLAEATGALEILESETAGSITRALDRLEPSSAHWSRLAQAATHAHLTRYHCEAQLAPLLRGLGLDAGVSSKP